jgi:hypothetical protein
VWKAEVCRRVSGLPIEGDEFTFGSPQADAQPFDFAVPAIVSGFADSFTKAAGDLG